MAVQSPHNPGIPPGGQQPQNFPKQQNPNATVYTVGASEYGGPGDSSTSGDMGSCGVHLTGRHAFAELYMGAALGGLPCGTKLKIEALGGGTHAPVIAEKLDIGAGGAPVQGHARRIDLWWETAKAIGFSGTGLVRISRVDGHPIIGPGDAKSGAQESAAIPSNIIPNPLEGLADWGKELAKLIHFITSSSGWVRIGKVVLGAGLLVIALSELTKISPEAATIADPAKKAVSAAKKV